MRLWDPTTHRPVGDPLRSNTSSVTGLAFGVLPSGRTLLATTSDDGTVRLWDAATGKPHGEPLAFEDILWVLLNSTEFQTKR